MFTGIIEERGEIREIRKNRSGARLTLQTKKTHRESRIGSSLSIDGVCLTIVQKKGSVLSFDVSKNTLRMTTLGSLKRGDFVNLERALKIGSRLGGHFVQGHVDGVGILMSRRKEGKNLLLKVKCPRTLSSYLIPRGSIAVDGISLTLADCRQNHFFLYLVPHTLQETTLGEKQVGEKVNLEVDLLSKFLFGGFRLQVQQFMEGLRWSAPV